MHMRNAETTLVPRLSRSMPHAMWLAAVLVVGGGAAAAWGQSVDGLRGQDGDGPPPPAATEVRSETGSPAPARKERAPDEVKGLDVNERLGQVVPLDLTLRDSEGNLVKLEDYFYQDKPIILNLGYYKCPMLCSLVISALQESVEGLNWDLGEQYEIVTVSIDPRETPQLAAKTKADTAAMLAEKGDYDVENGWHFLVGDRKNVHALADAVGFKYEWLEEKQQYIHPAVIVVMSPEGMIARYHYGLDYPAKQLKVSLFKASEGKTASPLEKVILSCYVFDETAGVYSASAMKLMRLGGAVTIVLVAILIGVFSLARAWKIKHRESQAMRREPAPTG